MPHAKKSKLLRAQTRTANGRDLRSANPSSSSSTAWEGPVNSGRTGSKSRFGAIPQLSLKICLSGYQMLKSAKFLLCLGYQGAPAMKGNHKARSSRS